MKISQKFELAAKEDRVLWSFEYFPPRTAQGLQNLYDRIERMRELGPEFIDITWSVRSSPCLASVRVERGSVEAMFWTY